MAIASGHKDISLDPRTNTKPGSRRRPCHRRVRQAQERGGKATLEKAEALKFSLGPDADYTPLLDEVPPWSKTPRFTSANSSPLPDRPQECLILTSASTRSTSPCSTRTASCTNTPHRLQHAARQLEEHRRGNQRVVSRDSRTRAFSSKGQEDQTRGSSAQLGSRLSQQKLGSQLDRVGASHACASLHRKLAPIPPWRIVQACWPRRIWSTNMVGEFPDITGHHGSHMR